MNGALPDNRCRYAGGAPDSTGLYHFGARDCDAAIGRGNPAALHRVAGRPRNGNRYA